MNVKTKRKVTLKNCNNAKCSSLLNIIIAEKVYISILQEKLPSVEHRVSKLQRMYQTLKLINPVLCEGSHVSEYLGQLMNDLQLLQGRLEVIPEDRELLTPGSDLHRWQENMADHISQHDGVSEETILLYFKTIWATNLVKANRNLPYC